MEDRMILVLVAMKPALNGRTGAGHVEGVSPVVRLFKRSDVAAPGTKISGSGLQPEGAA